MFCLDSQTRRIGKEIVRASAAYVGSCHSVILGDILSVFIEGSWSHRLMILTSGVAHQPTLVCLQEIFLSCIQELFPKYCNSKFFIVTCSHFIIPPSVSILIHYKGGVYPQQNRLGFCCTLCPALNRASVLEYRATG